MNSDSKVNILMVDDQPGKLLSYEAILSGLGQNLLKANSGREALDILLRHEIAVVLLDVSMPELDGFDLVAMIHGHPRFHKTPIILISAVHLTDVDRLKAFEHGAVDYVTVPVIPEILRAKVRIFTELHRKTRQLEQLNRELEMRVAERTEQLQQSAELLELATEAVIVRDWEGRVMFWNSGAQSMYGWKREDVLGMKLHQVLQTRFPETPEAIDKTLMRTGTWAGNLIQLTQKGQEITVACRQALKFDHSGLPQAVLEISRDITAELRAEETLRRVEHMAAMSQMAGIMAHEINNPLEAITNAFFLLLNHPSLDETARHYAELADKELSRVARITKQTLNFYREPQEPVSVKIADEIDNVLELNAALLERGCIALERSFRAKSAVFAVPSELKQVFMNLLTNAIQSMPDGGRLRVCTRDMKDGKTGKSGVRVSLVDTGAGIRPDDTERLFEPFFSTKSEKGTGLGLWISKGIVTKYEGAIFFRSLRAFGGVTTCFSVFIPGLDSRPAMGPPTIRTIHEPVAPH